MGRVLIGEAGLGWPALEYERFWVIANEVPEMCCGPF